MIVGTMDIDSGKNLSLQEDNEDVSTAAPSSPTTGADVTDPDGIFDEETALGISEEEASRKSSIEDVSTAAPSSPTTGADVTEPDGIFDEETASGISEEQASRKSSIDERRWQDNPRVKELHTTPDWWSLWIGLVCFAGGIAVVYAVPFQQGDKRVRYVVPQPMAWTRNPLDAWDAYGAVGTVVLLALFGGLYLISCSVMGKIVQNQKEDASISAQYMGGFAAMGVLATISFWMGRNEWCSDHGLGYAVFAILLGMLITNSPLSKYSTWITRAAKDGEFFIKCSLVLLAIQYDVLLHVGLPGLVVAWVGSSLAVITGFLIGTRVFKMQDSVAVLIAVGGSWCGASAISAIAPIVSATSEDVALSISVVSFFTVIFTFAQPYFAMATSMDDAVAGAWIGASVDQTGNVIVAAAILSDEATEVASVVKMTLNAGLGFLATVIACWWNSRQIDEGEKKPVNLLLLWDKFPKFVLGFLITSGILTGMMQRIEGTAVGEALPHAISSLNKWWFAIAFVGIGLTTDIKKMWKAARESGIIQGYLITNTFDIGLAFLFAYLLF
jgi:uncharacterized integral membrane protein (TIGR00698 family)